MTAEIVPLRPVFGATADEWAHFELLVGPGDLLPVVSRPSATISPQSTLKGKGKTPSVYNANRQVVGMPKWTSRVSTAADVARWMEDSDYGICIQCRLVRGLDLDVPDADLADRIEQAFRAALGRLGALLPARTRAGTGKRLLAFELVGSFPKRSFKVERGLVEFLANGQQFVAVGEHFDGKGEPTGTRYEWVGGLPLAVPRITQAQFEAAWIAIVEEFALEPASEGNEAARRDRPDLSDTPDPVADYIEAQGLVLGSQGEKLFVTCPWKKGHTSDSGISETCWLVAGTKGFAQGHFQCMHASCQGRKDEDFLDEIGFRTADFVNLDQEGTSDEGDEAGSPEAKQPSGGARQSEGYLDPWPKFKRDGKGAIESTIGNIVLALGRADIIEMPVPRHDTFRDILVIGERPYKDADGGRIRIALEKRGFKPVGRDLLRDALAVHAEGHRYDSAQVWLEALPDWDGVTRVEAFLPQHAQTEDSLYARAVGRYFWTALAGRVMDPGCKVDMVLLLQGDQGHRKSSLAEAVCPDPEQFREINLHKKDDDIARTLRGCLVGELAELRGLKTRDAESIKQWIVQKHERWVPKWFEHETTFARRCVLLATSNPPDVLDDETGERRWLPIEVLRQIDVQAFLADRDQLWAEGLLMWRLGGVDYEEAERLARAEHWRFKVKDSWTDLVADWLEQEGLDNLSYKARGYVQMSELAAAVGKGSGALTNLDERRLGKVLRGLGWNPGTIKTIHGRTAWAWKAPR